jgi:CRP-like cAMP-binding protein
VRCLFGQDCGRRGSQRRGPSRDCRIDSPHRIGGWRLHLIVNGWACRSHTLADGARQITDILLPGDLFGWTSRASHEIESEIRACGPVQMAVVRRDASAGREFPSFGRRCDWARNAESHILRSWLVNIGRRDARVRVACLIAELRDRLQHVGLVDGNAFTCPLTQEQLADVLGLTKVHVNRVLQRLRAEGLVMFDRPRVVISDIALLHAVAGYDRSGSVGSGG